MGKKALLLASVFAIATCGLVYELVAGTLASYLLGDSITQFSIIIGVYLFSMGIGSYLSKFIQDKLVPTFIRIELIIGLVGGFSAALLFLAFEWVASFNTLLYAEVSIIGLLVGLEIPLLMRILQDQFEFKDLVSNIFTFDYIGALLASLLFPLLLVPQLGLIRTSLLFGILNVLVAIAAIYIMRSQVKRAFLLRNAALACLACLLAGMYFSEDILKFSESNSYPDTVIYSESSPYQRVVLTRNGDRQRLYLNGNLQFDSKDEYRYHEALIHPGLAALDNRSKVLVLGGGDGLAVREILKYPDVDSIFLVDLDPLVTQLFGQKENLKDLNAASLSDPRVRVVNADAFTWLNATRKQFDFIAIDFPDPSSFSVGKLYTKQFYSTVSAHLAPEGQMVVQSTSPYVAPKAFWCVERTLQAVDLRTVPYHCYVPSFGEWGFIMAAHKTWLPAESYPEGLRFVNPGTVRSMVHFPPDMIAPDVEVNQLNNQVLVQYFESEWSQYE